jgi:hypothetical protein
MLVEFSTYKEKPVIQIKRDENDKFGLTMGLTKAKLCVEAIEEIKKFIADNDKPAPAKEPK